MLLKAKRKSVIKISLITLVVIALSPIIFLVKTRPFFRFDLFSWDILDQYINRQLSMLILAAAVIAVTILLANRVRLRYLNPRHYDGEILSEPLLGIRPKKNESWKNLGINFAIVISVVTAIVIYYQIIAGKQNNIVLYPNLLLVFIFAVTNSFSEEVIFRLSFVSVINNEGFNPKLAQVLSALTFGAVHYFGTPSGIPGVLMAAFLGWFLAKSMNETKGFFWAWFIHFLQDVIILFGFLCFI